MASILAELRELRELPSPIGAICSRDSIVRGLEGMTVMVDSSSLPVPKSR
jgi:hypothetical protein